jgi:glycosyltransferase involved in cell wall biosynthesis
MRLGYRHLVRRWFSDEVNGWIDRAKLAVRRGLGRPPAPEPPRERLPRSSLTLGGLVYTNIFNPGDHRKNFEDLLSAFVLAFRGRPDVTLVLKLAVNAEREQEELARLRTYYRTIPPGHACRVVVITDYLSDQQMATLLRVTTYYVNTSHAEGACLPLQQALAGGRPALAPSHTAMADYMDDAVGFVLPSHTEPTFWPHDPDRRLETHWHRLVWPALHARFLESAAVVSSDPDRFRALSEAARRRMLASASTLVVRDALCHALSLVPQKTQPATFARAS